MTVPTFRLNRRTLLAWGSVWIGVILVFVSQNVVWDLSFLQRVRWWNAALFEVHYWLPFVLATPLFTYMTSRHAIEGRHRTRKILIHLAVAVGFALLQPMAPRMLNDAAARLLFPPGDDRLVGIAEGAQRAYPAMVVTALWRYAVILIVCHAVRYYASTKTARLRTAELERQLAEAQLSALRMQLHPHFLFNALNSAAMLTLVEPGKAHEVLIQISDFFRTTLETAALVEVPLRVELDFLDRYLAIERVRFEDRLTVRFDIGEGTERLLVPTLILQPIVENAMRHGLGPKRGNGSLTIRSILAEDTLVLQVEDDGVGMRENDGRQPAFGVGLTNVQKRVNAVNRKPTPLGIQRTNGQGITVTVRLPARMAG